MDRHLVPNLRVLTPIRGCQIFAGGSLSFLILRGIRKKEAYISAFFVFISVKKLNESVVFKV